MAKKNIIWKTKGMNKDTSVSAFNPEFAFDNVNVRLATNEGNTMMSWVNERGTKRISLNIDTKPWLEEEKNDDRYVDSITGTPIGTAIINHQLVIFSCDYGKTKPDNIYVFTKVENKESGERVFSGKRIYNGYLNFNPSYPLETKVSYESNYIQKVYWTDNYNQPRMINIAASKDKLRKWNNSEAVLDYFFDFVPSFASNEEVLITKNLTSGGLFAPGIIQYAFTYINKYGQQSNIAYISSLYYLAHSNRGASPEEKVTCSFTIDINKIDTNFDYVRLYSIQRTSLNDTPVVKLLDDLDISKYSEDKIFSRELIYSEDTSLNLPYDISTGKRILTAKVTNGDYGVDVDGGAFYSFSNDANVQIVAYGDVGDGKNTIMGTIMSFDDFLKGDSFRSFDISYRNYHTAIQIGQDVDEDLKNKALELHADDWGISVNGELFTGEENVGFYDLYFNYHYDDQMWYITSYESDDWSSKSEEIHHLVYTDTGTTGSDVDPTELLYIGGREIKALTMEDKDGTLFLGNITQNNTIVKSIQDYYDQCRKTKDTSNPIQFKISELKQLVLNHATGVYSHTNQLNNNLREISTFKGGETYRFGFQLQKKTGEWTEPIFMGDVENPNYPDTHVRSDILRLPYAEADIPLKALKEAYGDSFFSVFVKIRPVVVFPTIGDRSVLCQGVINPTVFNVEDRKTNTPYAQASWFFRPYVRNSEDVQDKNTSKLLVSVTSIVKPSNADSIVESSINDFMSSNGLIKYMYVLVAEVTSNKVNEILNRGSLECRTWDYDTYIGGTDKTSYVSFDGAICLGKDLSNKDKIKYAFFDTASWAKPYSESNPFTNHEKGLEYVGLDSNYVEIPEKPFYVYSKMKINSQHLYYYEKPSDKSAPQKYVLKFYAGNSLHTATFTSMADDTSYNPATGNQEGSVLRFTHLDYLFNMDDCDGDKSAKAMQAMQCEIQGATSSGGSNTDFGIDQSIVTLNSPDIEFDTEVQTYGNEGLKLRIIGAIPITANASSHSIKTSTNMLESNHNNNSSGIKHTFGEGELGTNVLHNNIDVNAGKRLISNFLWNDVSITEATKQEDQVTTDDHLYNFLVYPWQRSGSLNDDYREKTKASSYLQTKKESNIWYSLRTEYFSQDHLKIVDFPNISMQLSLSENDEVVNLRLPQQHAESSDINYYSNIDKVLVNENKYTALTDDDGYYINFDKKKKFTDPISMKYKSTSHAVISLEAENKKDISASIPIMPYGYYTIAKDGGVITRKVGELGAKHNILKYIQSGVDLDSLFDSFGFSYLWLGELYKGVTNRFGGTDRNAILQNKWYIGGEAKAISDKMESVTLDWTEGDTYFQRYDCLKTYPFTNEDPNQIIEILSFMCETHVNIDGRYDKNRGQINNVNIRPQNFNLMNPVYSQQDNFFTYQKVDNFPEEKLEYPNHIYYSKTKENGSDVDMWTNVTLASTLELDGDKGQITSLNKIGDQLIAFQDSGISQILYNENVQIATQQGVPIEIANSGKVQGKRYLSNTVGCSNKWAMSQTPTGIYFMDSNDKSIYLFNGQLNNLSTAGGFNSWAKQNILSSDVKWTPEDFNNFIAYYDKLNQDVLFINHDIALAYSEKFNCFTSFYDYGGIPYFCNLDDTGVWIDSTGKLWEHQAGEYCNFFGVNKPFSMILIANQEPQLDKIFTNLEFRASVNGDAVKDENDKLSFLLPFDSLEVWNEYQHGIMSLNNRNAHDRFIHGADKGILSRKFRIWRCDIPRDNAPINDETESKLGIKRFAVRPLDRIRNPWAYLKLTKNAAKDNLFISKIEIHDIMASYFG